MGSWGRTGGGIPPTVRQVTVPGDLLRSVAPTQTPQQVLFLCALPDHALPAKLSGAGTWCWTTSRIQEIWEPSGAQPTPLGRMG